MLFCGDICIDLKNQKYYNYVDCKLTVKGMWRDRNEYGKKNMGRDFTQCN